MIARPFLRLRIGMTSMAIVSCALLVGACNGGGADDALDADGDGYAKSHDCDDDDASVHPWASEHCNAIDDDCDGDVDEGVLLQFYIDADHDTYGSDAEMVEACSQVPGAADNRYDCDDSDPEVNPDATEICANGTDEDCDGQDLEAYTWYADADGDGYGDPATTEEWCDQPTGFIADSSDCDDGDAAVHPGVDERCDNVIDDDCDDVVASSADADADGWYADACVGGHDCDDGDAAIRPDAWESCEDEIDSDCDGMKDDCTVPIFPLSDADAEYTGEGPNDAAGGSVAGAGDVNHDGYSDVLVGAPTLGAAYLVLGGPSPASGSLSDADTKYTGAAKGDGAGWSVAGVGDVDGDSYDDMLIGAPNGDAGAAYLVLGPSTASETPLSDADAVYTGEETDDFAGYSVARAWDVNGDKCADMLVGAYGNDAGGVEAGRAYLILGCSSLGPESLSDADAVYTGEGIKVVGQGDWVGVSVAGAGDMNGDGYGDIVVGADEDGHILGGDIGYVYILLGDPSPASAELTWGGSTLTGSSSGSLAGYSVAGAGDVDADGYPDVLVGAPGDSGKTYLMLGDATIGAGGEATYTDVSDGAGSSVAEAGDVDGDGFADLLIGAPGGDGAAYLVFGSASPASEALVDVDRKYIGEAADDGAGRSVAGVGDFDLDGYDDFFVGASSNDDGGTDAGAAYLIRGGL